MDKTDSSKDKKNVTKIKHRRWPTTNDDDDDNESPNNSMVNMIKKILYTL